MSLRHPQPGERCRCLQCGNEGEIEPGGPSSVSSQFFLAVDGVVCCQVCFAFAWDALVGAGCFYDVERTSVIP